MSNDLGVRLQPPTPSPRKERLCQCQTKKGDDVLWSNTVFEATTVVVSSALRSVGKLNGVEGQTVFDLDIFSLARRTMHIYNIYLYIRRSTSTVYHK